LISDKRRISYCTVETLVGRTSPGKEFCLKNTGRWGATCRNASGSVILFDADTVAMTGDEATITT
jgi:hypothetical protein